MPYVLKQATEKLHAFVTDGDTIPALNESPLFVACADVKANRWLIIARRRRMHRKRREAIALACGKFLEHINWITGIVCQDTSSGKIFGMKLETIEGAIGVSRRRLDRAIAVLRGTGAARSFERAERLEEGYRGHPALRQLTYNFFDMLDLGAAWRKFTSDEYQELLTKRNAAREAQASQAELHALRHGARRAAGQGTDSPEPRALSDALAGLLPALPS